MMSPTSRQSVDTSRVHFGAPLPQRALTMSSSRPRPDPMGLNLLPSSLRPHVLARDNLWLWMPGYSHTASNASGLALPLTDIDLQQVVELLTHAWTDSTAAVYGSALLVYHVFCNSIGVLEAHRPPTSLPLLLSFVSPLAGS